MKAHTVLAIGAHIGDAELTAGALLATCAVQGGKAAEHRLSRLAVHGVAHPADGIFGQRMVVEEHIRAVDADVEQLPAGHDALPERQRQRSLRSMNLSTALLP